MKTLSVFMAFALLMAAQYLAARMKQCGALPADRERAALTATNQPQTLSSNAPKVSRPYPIRRHI